MLSVNIFVLKTKTTFQE